MADHAQRVRFRILAGTAEQAKDLARQMALNPTEWRYASKWEDFIGLRGGVLLMYGTWIDRRDAHEIFDMAKQRNMSVLYIK
jgi:hypothetical protein